jgi:hypothetical protein
VIFAAFCAGQVGSLAYDNVRARRPRWMLFTAAARSKVHRDSLDHDDHRGLGHRVDAGSGIAAPNGGVAADGYHAAAFGEMRRRLDGQESGPHVDVQHEVEFLQADGLKIAQTQDGHVDDNDVEATKLVHRLGDGVADRRWICAVCLDRKASSAFRLNRSDRVGCFVRHRYISQTDIGALPRQASGSSGTDTTSRAEHDRDFASQPTIFTHLVAPISTDQSITARTNVRMAVSKGQRDFRRSTTNRA